MNCISRRKPPAFRAAGLYIPRCTIVTSHEEEDGRPWPFETFYRVADARARNFAIISWRVQKIQIPSFRLIRVR